MSPTVSHIHTCASPRLSCPRPTVSVPAPCHHVLDHRVSTSPVSSCPRPPCQYQPRVIVCSGRPSDLGVCFSRTNPNPDTINQSLTQWRLVVVFVRISHLTTKFIFYQYQAPCCRPPTTWLHALKLKRPPPLHTHTHIMFKEFVTVCP